jgi:hypothetical protein
MTSRKNTADELNATGESLGITGFSSNFSRCGTGEYEFEFRVESRFGEYGFVPVGDDSVGDESP